MWSPIPGAKHGADDLRLVYRESGGGGDCMFHSIAAALGGGRNYMSERAAAASAVTAENVVQLYEDMAAQCPATAATPMDIPRSQSSYQFSPERAWNQAAGSAPMMRALLTKAITTPGSHLWGDATLAALVEIAEGVNIILLAVDTGVSIPPTAQELVIARTVFGNWVHALFEKQPTLITAPREAILDILTKNDLTWSRALALVRKAGGTGWLRGRRLPVGSVRALCNSAHTDTLNIGTLAYSAERPTILLWNISNMHWVPVGVGDGAETIISPQSPLRQQVDKLLL